MRKLLGIIALVGSLGLMAFAPKPAEPINPIDTLAKPPYAPDHEDKSRRIQLQLLVDGQVFFVDNEFFGDRISGYTLPGFVLRPRFVLWRLERVSLEGGAHWLHLWGARNYPMLLSNTAWPVNTDSTNRFHVLPWLQAKVNFDNGLKLTLGSLGNSTHDLPLPLYNPDLLYVADPEAGVQMTYEGRHAMADLWVDWREYIWNQSSVPERFTAGLSGRLKHYLDNDEGILEIYLPFHVVGQHEGGQNMSVSHRINNNFNLSTGLGISYEGSMKTDLSCRMMWYSQKGNPDVPFSSGWGVYPELSLLKFREGSETEFILSYWYGENFVPLLGSWLYSNLSLLTPGLTFDRTQLITAKVSHFKHLWDRPCALKLEAAGYYYPTEHRMQYAIGCSILFQPSFPLK